jgi:hypothetical protein
MHKINKSQMLEEKRIMKDALGGDDEDDPTY